MRMVPIRSLAGLVAFLLTSVAVGGQPMVEPTGLVLPTDRATETTVTAGSERKATTNRHTPPYGTLRFSPECPD